MQALEIRKEELSVRFRKWLMGICGVGFTISLLISGVASAATDNNLAFIAAYENNELLQAKLQQQIDPTDVLNKLHAQISNLYKSEYIMDALARGPSKNNVSMPPLFQYLKKINAINANVQSTIRSIKGGRGDSQSSLNQQFKQILNEDLRMVQGHMRNLLSEVSKSSTINLVNDVNSLQALIFSLQHELIDLTGFTANVANPSIFLTKVSNVSNIKYNLMTVIPSNRPIKDMVIQLPWVTDANGNNIPAVGTYSLSGPTGAVGVQINTTTGVITIKSNATPGDYYVVYADSGSYASITIHVV